jgi:hypothetical protein
MEPREHSAIAAVLSSRQRGQRQLAKEMFSGNKKRMRGVLFHSEDGGSGRAARLSLPLAGSRRLDLGMTS